MSDAPQAQQAAQVAVPPVPPVHHDPLASLKSSLTSNINAAYAHFVGQVRMLPVNPGIMQSAFHFLDTGLVWLEKAIALIESSPVPLPPKAEAAVEAVKAVADVAEKVVEAVEPAPAVQPEAPDGA